MKTLLLSLASILCMWQNTYAVDPLQWIWKVEQTYITDNLEFSPDDKYILIQNYNNTAVVEAATGETIFTKYFMSFPVWSKDGKYIIALQGNALGTFWVKVETDTWKTIDSFPANSNLELFAVSPDERMAVIAKSTDILAFYDLVNKKLIKEVRYLRTIDYPKPDMYPTIVKMVWSDDGRYVIYTAHDGLIRFWEVEKDTITYTYGGGGGGSNVLSKSNDGSKIAFKTDKQGYALQIMDVATKQIVEEVAGLSKDVSGIAFSPDGNTIAIAFGGSNGTMLNVYTIKNAELKAQAKYSTFSSCAFSHNSKYLTSCVADILYLFDVRQILSVGNEVPSTFDIYPNPVANILKVNAKGNFQGIVVIDIVSITGTIVKTLQKNSSGEMTIDVTDIPSGTYTLVMTCGKKNYKVRFVKL